MPRTDEDIVDLADRLSRLGVRSFRDADVTLEFWSAVPAQNTSLPGDDEKAKPPARTVREAAERQGIGPLKFPGAERSGI